MINKKGAINPVQLVLAGALLVGIFLALGSGGGKAITNIFNFLGKLPGWAWIVIGFFVLFSMIGGKRR